jgi:hypothetical protein
MKKIIDQAKADIDTAVASMLTLVAAINEETQKTIAQGANAKSCVGHLEKAKMNVLAIEEVEETRRRV